MASLKHEGPDFRADMLMYMVGKAWHIKANDKAHADSVHADKLIDEWRSHCAI